MRPWRTVVIALLLAGCQSLPPATELTLSPLARPPVLAQQAWPVKSRLDPPEGLRPCCAFGYDLRAELLGVPVPFYRLNNVVSLRTLGRHSYNDNTLASLLSLLGIGREHDGLVYSQRGGFIDIAHVRDTADFTFWLFTTLYPRLGQPQQIRLSDELGQRRITLFSAAVPAGGKARYQLTSLLAAQIAFQLAAWHEIAQWYGFRSVPGFSEGVSAFSPEDLYSNMLGARIALAAIAQGQIQSKHQYRQAIDQLIPQALARLGGVSRAQTRAEFDRLAGRWWQPGCRVPQKFLVLRRNYQVAGARLPSRPQQAQPPALMLALPDRWQQQPLARFGQLQIWPGKQMARLPRPADFYQPRDFSALAQYAAQSDSHYLQRYPGRCD